MSGDEFFFSFVDGLRGAAVTGGTSKSHHVFNAGIKLDGHKDQL